MKRLLILLAAMLLMCAHALGEGEMILSDGPEDSELEESVETARELKFGDEGDDVSELQQRLTDLCYYTGNISGRYREGTRAAVKEFQKLGRFKVESQTVSYLEAQDFFWQMPRLEK